MRVTKLSAKPMHWICVHILMLLVVICLLFFFFRFVFINRETISLFIQNTARESEKVLCLILKRMEQKSYISLYTILPLPLSLISGEKVQFFSQKWLKKNESKQLGIYLVLKLLDGLQFDRSIYVQRRARVYGTFSVSAP